MAILVMSVTGLFAYLNVRSGALLVGVAFALPSLIAVAYLLLRRRITVARSGRKLIVQHTLLGLPLRSTEQLFRGDISMRLTRQRLDHRASLSSTTWWHLNFMQRNAQGDEQVQFFLSEHTEDNRRNLAEIARTMAERFDVPLSDET